MRVIYSLALFAASLIGMYSLQSQQGQAPLNGTRWVCAESKSGFTQRAYQNIAEINESHTLFFTSADMMTQYHKGEVTFHDGRTDSFEVVYLVHYQQQENNLKMKYVSLQWADKPNNQPLLTENIKILEGLTVDINYFIEDHYLYLSNRSGSEDSNFVCYSS
ncbi:hypothetical protein FCU94_14130 [Vibrio sp. JPW-9-11-11]|uniref:hypothetical protein n=1 Tax=Vibrio sp. JPW-9-11-11 TaxID=1416532 RepID=UPI001594DE55|nr:hypothetical protein [Vibrio sp. JPW-9-11-11]NVD08026.1 hypothetical protein [Vibrio sp. JPW-9-11-11]